MVQWEPPADPQHEARVKAVMMSRELDELTHLGQPINTARARELYAKLRNYYRHLAYYGLCPNRGRDCDCGLEAW
jgi:hypothetical protein